MFSFKSVLSILLALGIVFTRPCSAHIIVNQFEDMSLFNYEELKELSKEKGLNPALQKKLDDVFDTVILRSEPLEKTPLHIHEDLQEEYVRITHWNIQRGLNLDIMKAIFNGKMPDELLNPRAYEPGTENYKELQDEVKLLKSSDILFLNEVDMGVHRTKYRKIAEEIANSIGGAYAFATEFVEIEPNVLEDPDIQKDRFKGIHGNAIVSRYPIKNTEIIHLPMCYDWLDKENDFIFPLEVWRRIGTGIVFNEVIHREARRGGRIALKADISLPNGDTITAVSTHLESKTTADCRVTQLNHIFDEIKDVKNPLVFGGDLNSFEIDTSPTNSFRAVKNKATDIDFMARLANSIVNPLAIFINPSLVTISLFRKYRNPTVRHIPILFPNKTYPLFSSIRDYEFDDGSKFLFQDHRNERYLYGDPGELATSNHRIIKGYKSTFKLNRDYRLARFKYDWFFVKPDAQFNEEGEANGEMHYFPAFARTLNHLNRSIKEGNISDHSPITLDLMI